MIDFENYSPTKILFGINSHKKLNSLVKEFGPNCLIVTGKTSVKKFGYLKMIKNCLTNKKIYVFDKIPQDAKSNEVNEGIKLCRNKKIDFIIALGGGSVIDASKAISLYKSIIKIEKFIGINLDKAKNTIPLIAIPTTAGTGSEVTKGAIITNSISKFKSGVRGNQLFPKMAIIDPKFTLSLPKKVVVETGFDTFTHLFESYLAKKSNIYTEIISINGLRIILNTLPKILKNPKNLNLKSKIMFCSLLGGLNVANASTCLPHRLQQAMTDKRFLYKISHARGLSIVYPAWLEEVYPFARHKITKLKKELKIKSKKYNFILDFIKKIGINDKNYSIDENIINNFTNNVSGNLENDPIVKVDKKLIRKIYSKSFYEN